MAQRPTFPNPYLSTIDADDDNDFVCLINERDVITAYTFTIYSTTNTTIDNAQEVYQEVYTKFWDNVNAGKNIYDNLSDIINDANIQAKYPDLIDLCKLWQYTSNGIFYLNDDFSLASH